MQMRLNHSRQNLPCRLPIKKSKGQKKSLRLYGRWIKKALASKKANPLTNIDTNWNNLLD